jgi:hypothetical protein
VIKGLFMNDIAKNILRLAKTLLADDGLNGMSNREAKKFVNELLTRHTKGYFRDEAWNPIRKTFKELDRHNVNYKVLDSKYRKNEDGNLVSKRWLFEVNFTNDKGRDTKLSGTMVASGGGSVADPLDRYDVVAYIG